MESRILANPKKINTQKPHLRHIRVRRLLPLKMAEKSKHYVCTKMRIQMLSSACQKRWRQNVHVKSVKDSQENLSIRNERSSETPFGNDDEIEPPSDDNIMGRKKNSLFVTHCLKQSQPTWAVRNGERSVLQTEDRYHHLEALPSKGIQSTGNGKYVGKFFKT